jgi:hypothetical protein
MSGSRQAAFGYQATRPTVYGHRNFYLNQHDTTSIAVKRGHANLSCDTTTFQ